MKKPAVESVLIHKRRNLKNGYFSFTLGPFSKAGNCKPGQFVHIKLPGSDVHFRRAFSVTSIDSKNNLFEIIFKVVGRGTQLMSQMRTGDPLDILGPLGTSFSIPRKNQTAIMVAGGVGFPPLLFMAEHMITRGHDPKKIKFFYGGRGSADIIERTRIRKTGVHFIPITEDGSVGTKGLITQPLEQFIAESHDLKLRLFACGPQGMLKAVDNLSVKLGVSGQVSLEAPMPCGYGVCLGCVVLLTNGNHARVCCEGPVFEIGEVAL